MGEERHTKFVVSKKTKFLKEIVPNNRGLDRKVGIVCRDAAEQLTEMIRIKKKTPDYEGFFTSADNIYRNIELLECEEIEFTIPVLNTFLCFFFYKKVKKHDYKEIHTIENLKEFFNHIKIRNHKKKDRDIFHEFIADIDLIKDEIASPFNEYDYELNENWEFNMVKNPFCNVKDSKSIDEHISNHKTSLKADYEIVNITAGKVNVFSRQNLIPKKLNLIPLINPAITIGQSDYLIELRRLLFDENLTVSVQGMGGLGKTTLISSYIFKHFDLYDHIVYIRYCGKSWLVDFVTDQQLLNSLGIEIEEKDSETLFDELLWSLNRLVGKTKLLVIDNADNSIQEIITKLPNSPDWHMLFTSRERIDFIYNFELNLLSIEDSIILFKKYCTRINDQDEIEDIVNYIGRHTLTVEILAKTIQQQRIKPAYIFKKLSLDINTNVPIHHSRNFKLENIKSYLTSIFELSSLELLERWLLFVIATFPQGVRSYSDIYELTVNQKNVSTSNLAIELEKLTEKGWLQFHQDQDGYSIHQIIGMVVLDNIIDKSNLISNVISEVSEKISVTNVTNSEIIRATHWNLYGENYLHLIETGKIDLKNLNAIDVLNLVGIMYGFYVFIDQEDKRVSLFEKFSKYFKNTISDSEAIAFYTFIGTEIYLKKGDKENSLEYANLFYKNFLDNPETFNDIDMVGVLVNMIPYMVRMGEFEKAGVLKTRLVKIQKKIGNSPEVSGSLEFGYAMNFYKKRDYNFAMKHLLKAIEYYSIILDDNDFKLGACYYQYGLSYINLGKSTEGIQYLTKAIPILEFCLGEGSDKVIYCYEKLLNELRKENNSKELKKKLDDFVPIVNHYLDGVHSILPKIYNYLGIEEFKKKDFSIAEIYLQKAIEIEKEIYRDGSERLFSYYNNLAHTYKMANKLEESNNIYKNQLELLEDNSERDLPLAEKFYDQYADVLSQLKLYTEALLIKEKSVDLKREYYGDDSIEVAEAYNKLGLLYQGDKKTNKAMKYFIKALKIKIKVYTEDDSRLITPYFNVGGYLAKQEFYSKSEYYLLKATKLEQKHYGMKRFIAARFYHALVVTQKGLKKYKEAENSQTKRITIIGDKFGETSEETIREWIELADINKKLGNTKKEIKIRKKVITFSNTNTKRITWTRSTGKKGDKN